MKSTADYIRIIIITALILAFGIFVYNKYNKAQQEQERLQKDQQLIQEMFQQQDPNRPQAGEADTEM